MTHFYVSLTLRCHKWEHHWFHVSYLHKGNNLKTWYNLRKVVYGKFFSSQSWGMTFEGDRSHHVSAPWEPSLAKLLHPLVTIRAPELWLQDLTSSFLQWAGCGSCPGDQFHTTPAPAPISAQAGRHGRSCWPTPLFQNFLLKGSIKTGPQTCCHYFSAPHLSSFSS